MSEIQEFESSPVKPERLEPGRYFASSYAGEHVAGTEFVIGALFVAWGISTSDILWGLLWGNLLAVVTWRFICAPIAVETRLTLYAYLARIGGPGIIPLYSVVNGVLFCVLAGAMITVSASAVRIPFNIPPQVHWYPSDMSFVLIALLVGAVVVSVAIKGFKRVALFAQICSPWMVLMFIAGALSMLPVLIANTPGTDGLAPLDVLSRAADTHIWRGDGTEIGMWHVAAFAWICNLAMHGGLSDMTVLRFAKKSSYGWYSALGMYIGHYIAWVCAGVMGAGAALMLKTSITELDAGEVAFQALGAAGIMTVIIAGWTTSNPTIYRAGLAFHSLNPRWNRALVTGVTGVVTTIIACFPFVFSQLMNFVGIMGLVLAPIGAVMVAEHWLFPRLGLTRYWTTYSDKKTNWAAVTAWITSLILAVTLERLGLHLYFLLIPIWLFATTFYIALASFMGARDDYAEKVSAYEQSEVSRREYERLYLLEADRRIHSAASTGTPKLIVSRFLAVVSLLACGGMSIAVFVSGNLAQFQLWLLAPSLLYLVSATIWALEKNKLESSESGPDFSPACTGLRPCRY